MAFSRTHKISASRRFAFLGSVLGLAIPLTGCLEHPIKTVRLNSTLSVDNAVDLSINKDVDVLFVIDNSGSMGEEQAALAKNFGSFVDVLEQKGVDANYRLGVTTTDMGHPLACDHGGAERGVLQLRSCRNREQDFEVGREFSRFNTACTSICDYDDADLKILPTKVKGSSKKQARRWIERIDGETNLADKSISAADAFKCFGPQGVNGCGYESQLDSMYFALHRAQRGEAIDGKVNPNFGFMRESAILAVVHVTDEMDCSMNRQNEVFVGDNRRFYDKVFGAKSSSAFWSEGQSSPTSANCMNAGVRCSGDQGGNYESCVAVHKNVEGEIIKSEDRDLIQAQAVLRPVESYVGLLNAIEADKRDKNPSQEVIVAVIGGVAGEDGEVVYRQGYNGTALERENFSKFGIGFGCTNRSQFLEEKDPGKPGIKVPGGSEVGFALPPVRLKEFAESMRSESSQQVLYKICNDDLSEPLRNIAQKIRAQIKPACYGGCVLDTDPSTAQVAPSCAVFEQRPDGERHKIEECEREGQGDESRYKYDEERGEYALPNDSEVCYAMLSDLDGQSTPDKYDNIDPSCLEAQSNLEFKIQRKRGSSPPAGTKISAVCELSPNLDLDCPLPDSATR